MNANGVDRRHNENTSTGHPKASSVPASVAGTNRNLQILISFVGPLTVYTLVS